jgi:hypothetical protein
MDLVYYVYYSFRKHCNLCFTAPPTALQKIAFKQPNVAIYKFPFLLLPAIIVPLVFII